MFPHRGTGCRCPTLHPLDALGIVACFTASSTAAMKRPISTQCNNPPCCVRDDSTMFTQLVAGPHRINLLCRAQTWSSFKHPSALAHLRLLMCSGTGDRGIPLLLLFSHSEVFAIDKRTMRLTRLVLNEQCPRSALCSYSCSRQSRIATNPQLQLFPSVSFLGSFTSASSSSIVFLTYFTIQLDCLLPSLHLRASLLRLRSTYNKRYSLSNTSIHIITP